MIKVGEYIRTPYGIGKITNIAKHSAWFDDGFSVEHKFIECGKEYMKKCLKSTPDITELLKPKDLLYIDIDNGFEGGITVPRVPETQAELNEYIDSFKSGINTLVGVVPHELLQENAYWIGGIKNEPK